MTVVSVIREPDDPIAAVRISLGRPRGLKDYYIVFRGDPDKVLDLMREALTAAEQLLPAGKYQDDSEKKT